MVGFSVASLDHGVVSWKFLELGSLPAVMITSPADVRLLKDADAPFQPGEDGLPVRAKVWSKSGTRAVYASVGESQTELKQMEGSRAFGRV